MRKCKRCDYEGPQETFPRATVGSKYNRWICTKCYSKSKKKRQLELRELVNEIKKRLKCINCGNTDYRVMDFHHENKNDKTTEVATMVRRGTAKNKILKEIEKCIPLCANCHRIKHWEEKIGA